MQDEIEQAAYGFAKAVDAGEKVVVGVNRFIDEEAGEPEVFPIDPPSGATRSSGSRVLRADRDQAGVDAALADVGAAARGTQNLLVPMREALQAPGDVGRGVGRAAGGVRGVPADPMTRPGTASAFSEPQAWW